MTRDRNWLRQVLLDCTIPPSFLPQTFSLSLSLSPSHIISQNGIHFGRTILRESVVWPGTNERWFEVVRIVLSKFGMVSYYLFKSSSLSSRNFIPYKIRSITMLSSHYFTFDHVTRVLLILLCLFLFWFTMNRTFTTLIVVYFVFPAIFHLHTKIFIFSCWFKLLNDFRHQQWSQICN